MRQIGHLVDSQQASRFSDYLVAHHIRNQVEPEEGAWVIWILDEDQVPEAQTRLERFRAQPTAEEFLAARSQAAQVMRKEAQAQEEYQRRVRTAKSLFPKMGGYGVGPLTFALICGCIVVAIYTQLGNDREALRRLLLADPEFAGRTFLAQVRAGEYWRLLTPVLIHFGPFHLLFNMLWLYQLGSLIEARQGSVTFGLLVLVTAVVPMVVEYLLVGPGFVGGMSGLVYGLAGYVWMRGKYHPASGLYLDGCETKIFQA